MVPLELCLGLTGVLNTEIIAVFSARALKNNKTSEKKSLQYTIKWSFCSIKL